MSSKLTNLACCCPYQPLPLPSHPLRELSPKGRRAPAPSQHHPRQGELQCRQQMIHLSQAPQLNYVSLYFSFSFDIYLYSIISTVTDNKPGPTVQNKRGWRVEAACPLACPAYPTHHLVQGGHNKDAALPLV